MTEPRCCTCGNCLVCSILDRAEAAEERADEQEAMVRSYANILAKHTDCDPALRDRCSDLYAEAERYRAVLIDLAKVCGPSRPVTVMCPHDPNSVSPLHEYAGKARRVLNHESLQGERT